MADMVRINHAEAKKLLQSEAVLKELRRIGEQVRAATPHPDDYEVVEWVGINRGRVSVKTLTYAARAREARDHILLQALGSIGG